MKPLGDEQGQLRFADAAHAADAGDASAAFMTQSIDQSVDLQLAANEVSDRRTKLMQCCCYKTTGASIFISPVKILLSVTSRADRLHYDRRLRRGRSRFIGELDRHEFGQYC